MRNKHRLLSHLHDMSSGMTVPAARSKGLMGVTGEVTEATGGEVTGVTGGKEFPQGPSWVCNAGSGGVTGVGIVVDRVVTYS